MHLILSAFWLALAVAWFSGIAFIARLIGGYQWIGHMGQTRTVFMLALMGVLCIASAFALVLTRRLPRSVVIANALIVALHLLNALGVYILGSTNGHVSVLVMLPFVLIANVLPTSTAFVGIPPGNASLFILPALTVLACLISLAIKSHSPLSSSDA